MRRTRFIPALLVFLLSACNQQLIETQLPEGEVTISLIADERVEIVSAKSGTELPDVGDFWVELYNSEMVKFKKEKYSDIAGKTLSMNAGTFTLVASHGEPLGVGFDKPYYKAETTFTVEPQKKGTVEATAKLANVKVAVNYGDQIKADYNDYYTVVKHAVHKKTALTFEDNETRAGYIPGGDLIVTVYAEVDGVLKCFTLKDNSGQTALINCQPNDFITFNVNTGINYGDLIFDIKIDNGTELIEKSFYVPADAAGPDLKPSIVLSSFDDMGNFYVTEGADEKADNLGFTYKAYTGLEECVLSIDSDYMAGLGIPAEIDFTSLDEAAKTELEGKGFFLAEHAGIGVVDFADFIPGMAKNAVYDGKNTVLGTFTLRVKDSEGVIVTKTARIVLRDVLAVIDVKDYNIWPRKIVDPIVTLSNGNPAYAKVQVSMDGSQWYEFKDITSETFNMGTHADLTPGTTYHYRVVYRDNHVVSAPVAVTTEAAAQVANNSFEEWTSHVYETNYDDITWYQPWTTDQWWDTNTTVTLRNSLTVGYLYFKSFGCVQWSADAHTGNRSAQLTCVNVGNENSEWATNGGWRVGELFIGKGNEAKGLDPLVITRDGHAFSSRPASMTFWYEYVPYTASDAFSAEISIKSSDGTVLGTSYATGSAKSQWTSMTLPLNYTVVNKRPATIHIKFTSSVSSSHDCEVHGFMDFSQDGPYLEIAGETKTGDNHQIKLSATLRIDDVTLNY